jgi:DNA-directed RNA polymerase subunit M/transcription elongation factor TFIIS
MKPCRKCGSTKIPPVSARRHDWICTKCQNAHPANQKARRNYMRRRNRTAAGKRVYARRIWVAGKHYGMARTPEEAAALRSYIRRRLCEFKQNQRDADASEREGR